MSSKRPRPPESIDSRSPPPRSPPAKRRDERESPRSAGFTRPPSDRYIPSRNRGSLHEERYPRGNEQLPSPNTPSSPRPHSSNSASSPFRNKTMSDVPAPSPQAVRAPRNAPAGPRGPDYVALITNLALRLENTANGNAKLISRQRMLDDASKELEDASPQYVARYEQLQSAKQFRQDQFEEARTELNKFTASRDQSIQKFAEQLDLGQRYRDAQDDMIAELRGQNTRLQHDILELQKHGGGHSCHDEIQKSIRINNEGWNRDFDRWNRDFDRFSHALGLQKRDSERSKENLTEIQRKIDQVKKQQDELQSAHKEAAVSFSQLQYEHLSLDKHTADLKAKIDAQEQLVMDMPTSDRMTEVEDSLRGIKTEIKSMDETVDQVLGIAQAASDEAKAAQNNNGTAGGPAQTGNGASADVAALGQRVTALEGDLQSVEEDISQVLDEFKSKLEADVGTKVEVLRADIDVCKSDSDARKHDFEVFTKDFRAGTGKSLATVESSIKDLETTKAEHSKQLLELKAISGNPNLNTIFAMVQSIVPRIDSLEARSQQHVRTESSSTPSRGTPGVAMQERDSSRIKDELQQLRQAVQSVSQAIHFVQDRYDNLTTEHVVRCMLGQLPHSPQFARITQVVNAQGQALDGINQQLSTRLDGIEGRIIVSEKKADTHRDQNLRSIAGFSNRLGTLEKRPDGSGVAEDVKQSIMRDSQKLVETKTASFLDNQIRQGQALDALKDEVIPRLESGVQHLKEQSLACTERVKDIQERAEKAPNDDVEQDRRLDELKTALSDRIEGLKKSLSEQESRIEGLCEMQDRLGFFDPADWKKRLTGLESEVSKIEKIEQRLDTEDSPLGDFKTNVKLGNDVKDLVSRVQVLERKSQNTDVVADSGSLKIKGLAAAQSGRPSSSASNDSSRMSSNSIFSKSKKRANHNEAADSPSRNKRHKDGSSTVDLTED